MDIKEYNFSNNNQLTVILDVLIVPINKWCTDATVTQNPHNQVKKVTKNYLFHLPNIKHTKMSGHKYHFDVAMSCSGCSGAVNRVLNKLEGVSAVDISLESQTVDVTTIDALDYDTVYNTIAKTGKKINDGKIIQ